MAGDHDKGPDSKIGFTEFILSIATNAIIHLGGEDTTGARVSPAVDLPLAAQHIDIIDMLKEKTKGNLEQKEAELVDTLLYDLRMKYLEVAQESKTQ